MRKVNPEISLTQPFDFGSFSNPAIWICDLSSQSFGFIWIFSVSCHATAHLQKVWLPAQLENCCLWEIVSFVLVGAYQNVAWEAQRVQICIFVFFVGFCPIHKKWNPAKTFQEGYNPKTCNPAKNIPGRSKPKKWNPAKKLSEPKKWNPARSDRKELNAISKDCRCEELSCEELTKIFGDMKLND